MFYDVGMKFFVSSRTSRANYTIITMWEIICEIFVHNVKLQVKLKRNFINILNIQENVTDTVVSMQ